MKGMIGILVGFLGLWIGNLTNYSPLMWLGALLSIIGLGMLANAQRKTYENNKWLNNPWNKKN